MDSDPNDPLDWENWTGDMPFWQHAFCGSIAGVMEHISLFPLDTIKTRLQTNSTSSYSINSGNSRNTLNSQCKSIYNGVKRRLTTYSINTKLSNPRGLYTNLFKGSNVIIIGCVPAHVLYFTVYEKIKNSGNIAISGATATVCHDLILTPADVIKQRLQLNLHSSTLDCVVNLLKTEGFGALFRSLSITLFMNIPYHSLLVTIIHLLKKINKEDNTSNYKQFIYSGLGGAIAGALTTPLDVIKTRLQTQTCHYNSHQPYYPLKYKNIIMTYKNIYRNEGLRGFMRGMSTRVGMCTPSAAISWGTYETLKNLIKLLN
ncbi:mitochondrial solute carrier-like protein, putative [Theileria annulata]|uniref:Mitochondrial solute carrier-like protein, putative n=1 Tax=Theileria annulata TaxID=5874 RepID=Q4UEW0_THEAN|nr:mitochondrial solute carrier-like protein, putative [Theileria annulata]CAI74379.1 mitochondrial solute carrier-like protein, putative [Theileria annulata]|eukprot:XP_952111.1 mitochondrial solute carrier-like protein, putative [Theileria annulata]